MHPILLLLCAAVIVIAGAIFVIVMLRRNRREGSAGRPEETDPIHLERDDDPVRRRAMSEGPGHPP